MKASTRNRGGGETSACAAWGGGFDRSPMITSASTLLLPVRGTGQSQKERGSNDGTGTLEKLEKVQRQNGFGRRAAPPKLGPAGKEIKQLLIPMFQKDPG